MKTILYTLVLTGIAGFFAACSGEKESAEDKAIKNIVEHTEIPQKAEDGSTVTGFKYKDKTLVYEVEVSKEEISAMDADKKRAEAIENLQTEKKARLLYKKLSSAGASVRYVYYNDKDTVAFTLTPEDLKTE